MHGMAMSGPCCQMDGNDALVPPNTSSLPEHAQTIFLAHRADMESVQDSAGLRLSARAHLPPDFSPGGTFILRI